MHDIALRQKKCSINYEQQACAKFHCKKKKCKIGILSMARETNVCFAPASHPATRTIPFL